MQIVAHYCTSLLMGCALAAATAGTSAQPVERDFGPYTVRASAVVSTALPAETARRHGIEPAADRGVLNVVVLRGANDATVAADVSVDKINLLGQREALAMREVRENERVSYLGVFGFEPLRNFRFVIHARPLGSEESYTIELEDRFRTTAAPR